MCGFFQQLRTAPAPTHPANIILEIKPLENWQTKYFQLLHLTSFGPLLWTRPDEQFLFCCIMSSYES